VAFLRFAGGRFAAGDFLLEGVVPGLAGRAAVVFVLELRALVVAVFFLLVFFLAVAFEADFFRVTLVFASFRLTDDFPALVVFFLLVFLPVVFLPVFFVPGFFLLTFFLLTFLVAFFLLTAFFFEAFFREVDFLPPDFLDADAATRLREVFFDDFFETFFLAAAVFFGMRSTPGRLQMKAAIIQIRVGRGSLIGSPAGPWSQGRETRSVGSHEDARCSAMTVVYKPPRTLKSAVSRANLGLIPATRSLRISLVTAS
jgi:hypothetical protein